MALLTGWTMNEVRDHTWPDLVAMLELLSERATEQDRQRALAEARAQARAGRRR